MLERKTLYERLKLPNEVVEKLNEYERTGTWEMPVELQNKILCRDTWENGIKELQVCLGEDSDGLKILWELLNVACSYSYESYTGREIPEEVFVATMKFVTRFLKEHYKNHGTYKFVWAWWFPRQLSLEEFRIGALEYEFVEGEKREIYIHIPSDADLSKESVQQSLAEFYEFRNTHFPQWQGVPMMCDSWMLVPVLKELLDEDSNILAFQNLFEIEEVNEDARWFMDWVYPGIQLIDENLPEETSLQRRMKEHLLQGKKVGWAKGHLKE